MTQRNELLTAFAAADIVRNRIESRGSCAPGIPHGGFMSTFFNALQQAEQERLRRVTPPPLELIGDRIPSPVVQMANRRGFDQLKLLFDYSKFQIGLYTTFAIVLSGAMAFRPVVFRFHRGFMALAVAFICLAGVAAGIIASRCPHFASWSELWAAKIGPFRWKCLPGEYWTYLQHVCFALALAAAALSLLLAR
jgi:hypothetical protein